MQSGILSTLYPTLLEPFQRARHAYESHIAPELGVIDLGDLHPREHSGPKRNVVRLVDYTGKRTALKVYGDNDAELEFATLDT